MSPLIAFLQQRLGAARQLLHRLNEPDDDLEWDGGQRLAAFPYGGEILPLSGLVWVVEPWPDVGYAEPGRRDEDAPAAAAPARAGGLVGLLSRRFGSARPSAPAQH